MTYRIQTFITLVMASLMAVVGVGILYQNYQRYSTFEQMRAMESTELLRIQRHVSESNSRPTHTFSYDYSFWGEMVDFVASGDSAWAHENLDPGLQTFSADVVWAMRPTGEIIYAVSSDSLLDCSAFPLFPKQAKWDSVAPLFMHHFIRYHGKLLEIFTAPIQPSNDEARVTPPSGLMATARFWSDEYLRGLTDLMGCRARLFDSQSMEPDSILASLPPSVVACLDTIRDVQGGPIALLLTERESPLLAQMLDSMRWESFARPLSGFALILALYLILLFSVGKPLALLSTSLTLQHPERLDHLRHGKTEFSDLARMIVRFFDQRDHLQQEVAERQKAEQALQVNIQTLSVAEERYRRLVEMSPDAILLSQHGIIRFANNRAASMLKHQSPDDLKGKSILEYIHPDFHAVARKRIAAMEADGTHATLMMQKYVATDLTPLDVEVVSSPIVFHDESACLTIVRDVTERVKAEQENQLLRGQLEVAQRMESLAVLAGGVAHDLNNMLGPLVAYPELILMDIPEDSPARANIQSMEKAANQAVDVIQDLLALARRGRYEMTAVQLNDVISSYLQSPSAEAAKSKHPGITLDLALSDNLPAILGSFSHLQKVAMNLIVNAFDSIKESSGTITISTTSRTLDHLECGYADIPAGNYVIFFVSDTGVGISPEDRRKIFEPYFSKKKMETSGSGLGLAVVYGILKDHKGYYDIISEVGKGSAFVLYFPVTNREIVVRIEDKQVFPGAERILIVDDLAEQRDVASALLNTLGYATDAVATGGEAVARLRTQAYDLLVIDMILEDVWDGLDTFKAVLSEFPDQRAVVVSGFSETDRVKEMLNIGAGAFVKKPYTRTSLSRAVRRTLDGAPRESTIV